MTGLLASAMLAAAVQAASCPEGWDGFGTVKAVCIGEQTARAAREAGFRQITTAAKATLEALVEAAAAAQGFHRIP